MKVIEAIELNQIKMTIDKMNIDEIKKSLSLLESGACGAAINDGAAPADLYVWLTTKLDKLKNYFANGKNGNFEACKGYAKNLLKTKLAKCAASASEECPANAAEMLSRTKNV